MSGRKGSLFPAKEKFNEYWIKVKKLILSKNLLVFIYSFFIQDIEIFLEEFTRRIDFISFPVQPLMIETDTNKIINTEYKARLFYFIDF